MLTSVVFKYINIPDMNIEKIFADSTAIYIIDVMHLYRHSIKCLSEYRHNGLNSCSVQQYSITLTTSYENQSVHRAVSKLVKTGLNTAITVKLLKSKVTLLNICEKLKMTQRDTGNIKSKVNETCCCETCHN